MLDIVIWGTGAIARKLYYVIMENKEISVKYFVDNSPVSSFYGYEVYRPDKENCGKYLVVVASHIHYEEISAQMTEYGLKELKNFIPYEALEKTVVIVHGNCHVHIIKEYLKTSKTFNDKYYLYPLPLIQDNKKRYIKDDLLENCDVFIYQDIRRDNQFDERLSADYLAPKVHKRMICIPNVFGMGVFMFPQAVLATNDNEWRMLTVFFNYRDANIDTLWRNGKHNIRTIVDYLNSTVYDAEYVKNNLEECFEKMESREQFWDVKISAYIKNNYKKVQLFYEPAHPCNNILKKISEGILDILGIDKNELSEIAVNLGEHEIPVYKCVKEVLGLEYDKKYIRVGQKTKLVPKDMDLEEYCREYCYWCYGWHPENI